MTTNQIAFQNFKETQRSNMARELENYRHNYASEGEAYRHNYATERLGRDELIEKSRSNRQNEKTAWENAISQRQSANAAFLKGDAAQKQALYSYDLGMKNYDQNERFGQARLVLDAINTSSNAIKNVGQGIGAVLGNGSIGSEVVNDYVYKDF